MRSIFYICLKVRIKTSQYGPRGVGCRRAANFLTKGCNESKVGANPIK